MSELLVYLGILLLLASQQDTFFQGQIECLHVCKWEHECVRKELFFYISSGRGLPQPA